MKIHIVHAHPEPASFCAAMRDAAVERLTAAGHAVTQSDLYAMKFDPVAKREDFVEPKNPDYLVYALEQRHAFESGTLPPDLRHEIDQVMACDLLMLNFPIYWFSVPAIMKGWIDRVFVSGAFYGGRRIYDRGGMKGKRAMVSLTLGGRDDMLSADGIHGDATAILKPLLQGSLGYVGFAVHEPFYAFHVPYLPLEEREAIMAEWHETLDSLDSRPTLEMPSMANFDDRLKPLPRG